MALREVAEKGWDLVKNVGKIALPAFLGYGLTRIHDKHSRRISREDEEESYKRRSKYAKRERKRRMKDYVKYYPKISAMRRQNMKKDIDMLRSEREKDRAFTYRKVS